MLVTGALFHDRYRVVRSIKAGGMGAVFEVHDETTNRRRALKVMHPGVLENSVMRGRFAQEATVTGAIESEHLVQVLDAGVDTTSQLPFLVMELLVGEELGGMVKRRGPLPEAEAVLYLSQVALALDKTHAAGIVHRDLKPENLFVTYRDDGSPCVKVLDFGIAKMVAQAESADRQTRNLGTPPYMSPEQITGDGTIGPRSDLYTLGHIAYALLVGRPYWDDESRTCETVYAFLMTMMQGAKEPPTQRARRHRTELPAAFDGWFGRATAVMPAERFERASDQIAALAAALGVGLPAPVESDIFRPAALPFAPAPSPHAGTGGPYAVSAPSKSKTKTPLLALVALAFLLVGAFVGVFVWRMGKDDKPTPASSAASLPPTPPAPTPTPAPLPAPSAAAVPSATPSAQPSALPASAPSLPRGKAPSSNAPSKPAGKPSLYDQLKTL